MNNMKKLLTLLFAFIAMVSSLSAQESEPDYLCFEVEAGTTIGLGTSIWNSSTYTYVFKDDVDIQYSFDKKNWSPLKYNEINVETDCYVYFKGTNTCFYKIVEEEKKIYAVYFVVSKPFKCSGNIMTLIDETGETTTLTEKYAFAHFFESTPIVTAPKLPALVLSDHCYEYMFDRCLNLTVAPELPATTLSDCCYKYMFEYCESLTTAPELPATVLAISCYENMFFGCKSLSIAPKLPAINLTEQCYLAMFTNCTNLKTASKLPATTMANSCYTYMFEGCTNLLIAPELPATTLAERCYESMFLQCKSLKTTPVLPAKQLKRFCYHQMFEECYNLEKAAPILFETPNPPLYMYPCWRYMFSSCNKLKYISVRFTKWKYRQINTRYGDYEDVYVTKQWVKNINNGKGTFVCPATLPKEYDENCIPYGWTVKSLDEITGYNVRVAESSKDYITTSETMEIEAGSKIYVAVIDRTYEGYAVSNLSVVDDNQNPIAIENEGAVYSFTMPAKDVTISVSYVRVNYTISTDEFSTADKNNAYFGDKIRVSVSDRVGYKLVSATCNGRRLYVTDNNAEFSMPAANVEIKTNYSLIEYNITTDEFITPNKSKATINDKISFTVADRTSDGYKLEKVFVNNVEFSGRELDMKDYLQDVTINAVYSKIDYSIIVDEYSSVDKNKANVGDKITVTFNDLDGYKFISATYNGNPLTVSNKKAEFPMPAANVEIKTNYSPITYIIRTDEYVTPSKTRTTINDKVSFSIADRTAEGYKLDKVLVNNVEFTGREFEMKDYVQNVEIKAVYSKIVYTITTDKFTSTDKTTANVGDDISVTIKNRDGYRFVSAYYNGKRLSVSYKKATFTMPAANVVISTNYSLIDYDITTNEFVTANQSKATINDKVSFTVADRTAEGYKLDKVLVNDVEFAGREIDIKDYFTNITISAVYSKIGYTITTDEFSTVNKTTANLGENISVTIKNRDGYKFASASYNGNALVVSNNKASFTMPAANVMIKTNYSLIEYNITAGDFVTANKSKATINDNVSFSVADRTSDGYKLDKVLVNNVEFAGREIDMKDYLQNVAITAVYSKIGYTITTDEFSTVNKTTANVGDNISVTIKNIDGYKLTSASYNGNALVVSNNKASFTMPAANVEIKTTYSIIDYNITAGEFVTANKSKATINDKVSFSIADRTSDGYKLDKVLVNNVEFSGREIDMKDYLQDITITAVYSKIYNEDLFVSDMEVETDSYCAGDILNLTFKTNNIAKKYQILFAESAKNDGFQDTDFGNVVTPEKQSVSFEIPQTAKYGKYQGFIKVVDLYGNVSEKYPFDFNIGYPNDIIETKYSDLICVNNFNNNYTAYQWLKNGKEIVGANKQFFIDYPMLNGVYSVIVTDKGGNKIRVCDFKVKDLTSKKSTAMVVKVYPNPAISSQPVTIAIDGFEEDTKYEIVIYNQLGALVQRLPNAQETNIIRLQSGVYSGAVVSQKGKQTFKLIISD